MKIKHAATQPEKDELDQLLWDVLWKPLNLPRHIRKSFELNKPEINLLAIDNEVIIGALVANWLSENEVEIRHIAINPDFQGSSAGRLLVEELFKLVQGKTPLTIHTYAVDYRSKLTRFTVQNCPTPVDYFFFNILRNTFSSSPTL